MVPEKLAFSPLSRREIEATFSGGHITSDAGLLLLREVERRQGLIKAVAAGLTDTRQPSKVRHALRDLVAQRVFALAGGYEDLNDHDHLRLDHALQTVLGRNDTLAGKSTLGRLEQHLGREAAVQAHRALWQHFIDQHRKPPKEIILDFDATDVPVHGDQEGRFFHGYYDHYCFLPLYVFCGRHLLVSYLRPSNIDGARHSWALLALLARFIRSHWPDTRIIFRGDSGFCRHRMLRWCERNQIDYLVGIAKNDRLLRAVAPVMDRVRQMHEISGEKQTCLFRFLYAAKTWGRARMVIARLEHSAKGPNPRFILASWYDDKTKLYYEQYCARGDMENRIKDQQLDLFAKRTSSPHWWSNQWRLILSGLAYTLIERLRDHLKGTELARMSAQNLRLKLFKIGAVIIRNTRRIRVLMSEAYPYPETLALLLRRLRPT